MVEPGVSFAFDASKIKKQEEEEAHALDKEKYKWLFRYNSQFISYWEIFIILVAIINSITIPFQVFYEEW